jgi:DNA replication protein DnaC
MIEQTKQILSSLKCHGILSSLDFRLAEATSHGWGHAELLSALVTDEQTHRENQKIVRRLKAAHFRTDATLERLDVTSKRNLSRTQVQDLRELKFVTDPRNVLILGPTGVGKTYLASALGNHACRQGYSCLFFGMNYFLEKIALHRADGTFLKFRQKLTNCDLLILDDLGLKIIPQDAVQDLHDILEERYQSKSTMITTQLPLMNWKEIILDPLALEGIIDRMIHGSVTLEIQGESYRKKRGKSETP